MLLAQFPLVARKLRIEFEGARYHVINRGNYRSNVFKAPGAAGAFLKALEEAVAKHGWILFGYVLMRNHYHLAVETPQGNLSVGMHWLQSTFATRFNRFRNERGHLFQGRFQSAVLEDEHAVRRVVDYIHLNPVRAKVVSKKKVGEFRWSSLNRLIHKTGMRGLDASIWMDALELKRTPKGWTNYIAHLEEVCGSDEDGLVRNAWVIGSQAWRRNMAKTYGAKTGYAALTHAQRKDLQATQWEARFRELLRKSNRSEKEIARDSGYPDWKLGIASVLKNEMAASSQWIADRLQLGSASSLRVYLSQRT